MTDDFNASNLPASCSRLYSEPEEPASSSGTSQKRREDPEKTSCHADSLSPVSGGEIVLRPYQAESVQRCWSAMDGGIRRLLLYSPTGSGKTEIAMSVIKGALARGKRVTFLCNRIHLVDQTCRRALQSGIAFGVIQGENTARLYEPVIIASIQTVARRGLPQVDLLIIDEAHAVSGSEDFRKLLRHAECPVIGLSATPFSHGLGQWCHEAGGPLFEHMIIGSTIRELIDEGYLVDCDIYAPSEPDLKGIKTARNAFGETDYTDAGAARVINTPVLIGDIVRHWLKLAHGTPTVCFAASIAHSKHIVEQFMAAGVPAEHIDSYTDDAERQAILMRLRTGEIKIISNVAILAEGWDFPACATLILARPTRSLIRYLQMAGRVLRPYPGKNRALILDHSGTVARLGFPTDDIPLELDTGKQSRAGGKNNCERPVPKICPLCKYMKAVGVRICPKCGFVPERQPRVDVVDKDLVRIEKEPARIGRQAFYSQLLAIAKEKGYQTGWCRHRFRDRFGNWPGRSVKDVVAEPTKEVRDFLTRLRIRDARSAK
ncbi:DEAD/DEAH box helicase [Noviherbaspirillum galbum]|uniref:DEAD/DEAH box helicase family protein n=1 Tax=Noviherbaspirillum galbum TaxID=2709383 RepID=A0A6B3SP04_9BURK|nr:DEAD/DEAH box helicase [Noviherbaspirillum galbum]NEX62467.1 DEAD/DEAH box helicase family protein [Noviherbaspirillum galbum]